MNLTPHALNLAGFTVPPSGTVARVEMVHPVSIPCWEVRPGPVIDLPEVDPDALFRDDLDFTADPERTPSRGPKGNLTCANCGGRATDHHACSDGTIWCPACVKAHQDLLELDRQIDSLSEFISDAIAQLGREKYDELRAELSSLNAKRAALVAQSAED